MAKKRTRYEWDDANMVWRDGDGNKIDHPRYSLKPASLGNTFIRSYLKAACHKGTYINDWRKTNMNFTLRQIESAVKSYEKAYRAATKAAGAEDTEPLPRLRKRPIVKDSGDLKKARAVAAILNQYGHRQDGDPRIEKLVDATQTKKK
tara:strand:+ start:838 stop:1281 length:444 start_codon:yes stop_codon:yes gene_type:complete